MDGPVIVFEGRNEIEAHMARDVLASAMVPVFHVPSLSTGLFAQRQSVRVAVPAERAAEAVNLLREAGFDAAVQDRPRGIDAVNDAVGRALPRPLRLLLLGLFLAMVVVSVLAVWLGGGSR